jgi:hypothetical protein
MVFNQIAYYPILGIPLLIYLGGITIVLLILTAIAGYLVHVGKAKFPIHRNFVIATITFAVIHGFLAFASRYIG